MELPSTLAESDAHSPDRTSHGTLARATAPYQTFHDDSDTCPSYAIFSRGTPINRRSGRGASDGHHHQPFEPSPRFDRPAEWCRQHVSSLEGESSPTPPAGKTLVHYSYSKTTNRFRRERERVDGGNVHSSTGKGHVCMHVCMVITYGKIMNKPGKAINTARGQLNRENDFSLSPCAPQNLVSRDRFGCPVLRQPVYSPQLRLNLVLTHGISPAFHGGGYLFSPPYAIGSVPNLSGHAIAYRWRSLRRVLRHTASIKVSSSNGHCLLRFHHGPIDVFLSFPIPTFGMKGEIIGKGNMKPNDHKVCCLTVQYYSSGKTRNARAVVPPSAHE